MSSDSTEPASPRILIIDNYDSYTFNLYQYCTLDVNNLPTVIRNDQFSWTELKKNILPSFDAVVISPGPGRPDHPEDVGVCLKLLEEGTLPILGVCLGLQALAYIHGGEIVGASPPKHGRLSPIYHNSDGLFAGIPSPFNAVRYHSLIACSKRLPICLNVTATCPGDYPSHENVIMGLSHASKPIWSVQFHPESICTEHGQQIVGNFISLATLYWKHSPRQYPRKDQAPINLFNVIPQPLTPPNSNPVHTCVVEKVDVLSSLEQLQAFETLFRDKPVSFWLDSARRDSSQVRFSYMGDISGQGSFVIRYDLCKRLITKECCDDFKESIHLNDSDSFFAWMSRQYEEYTPKQIQYLNTNADEVDAIPYLSGFVGYFGYEMKSESMHSTVKTEIAHDQFATISSNTGADAAFIFSSRNLIFDHVTGHVYLASLHEISDESARHQHDVWRESVVSILLQNFQKNSPANTEKPVTTYPSKQQILKMLRDEKATYIKNVEESLKQINEGETYEVCLTTQLTAVLPENHPDPFVFYKHLRSQNPAPYGAFISFGNGLHIASSSPERFIRVDRDSWTIMKPIKGTLKRCQLDEVKGCEKTRAEEDQRRVNFLQNNEKDRAENLMIVDLIRNDLNQFCEPMSVLVPSLMHVETYETVHQLVTTVKGKVRSDLNPVDAVMRSFPPGSMTGAPKLRTVHILEHLEKAPRGVYSGCLGFFSVTGSSDFSVIIRTALFHNDKSGKTVVSVGAGGAIIALSDPEAEFDEMLLKANSVLPSLNSIYFQ